MLWRVCIVVWSHSACISEELALAKLLYERNNVSNYT